MNEPPRTSNRALMVVALLIVAAYTNHFGNSFHFDDSHTIVENPVIRQLSNIPRFFTDARTFSTHEPNQTWRPLVSTSLAIDYWLGRGYVPFWFHLSTFVVFLGLCYLVYLLYLSILDRVRPDDSTNATVALVGAAVYGLHPVCAETVNYVIQRADVYVALGLVSALVIYARCPRASHFGLYLAPVVLAALCKPTALAFPLVLAAWLLLFERQPWRQRCIPLLAALAVDALMGVLHWLMTPSTYTFGNPHALAYRLTQPYVALHYVIMFFWPMQLSADTDWTVVTSMWAPRALTGFLFLIGVLFVIASTARESRQRPVAFGLTWFLVTMLPTSLAPLAEVTNDHRMLGPFVGLTLAVVSAASLVCERARPPRAAVRAVVLVVLIALGVGTFERNAVWHTEKSLWSDVVAKSPRNGRAWLNYGNTLLGEGRMEEAKNCYNVGLRYAPNYDMLEVELGVVCAALRQDDEAERHYQRALLLNPQSAEPAWYYARWLLSRHREAECIDTLKKGLKRDPQHIPTQAILVYLYKRDHNWRALQNLVDDLRLHAPDSPVLDGPEPNLLRAEDLRAAEEAARGNRNAQTLVHLSWVYHQSGRLQDSIHAAQDALALDPTSADAWNNICAADLDLNRWDDAIDAAQHALTLNPNLSIARNNLRFAESQRAHATTSRAPRNSR